MACQVDRNWLAAINENVAEYASFLASAALHQLTLIWIFDEQFENVKSWIAERRLVGWIITDGGTLVYQQKEDNSVAEPQSAYDLPQIVSRTAHVHDAINGCLKQEDLPPESFLLAGAPQQLDDLWNSDYRKIVLIDTCRKVARQIFDQQHSNSQPERVYLSEFSHLTGVKDGCRWYELLSGDARCESFELGATPVSYNRTYFRVWAPRRRSITVHGGSQHAPVRAVLQRHANGYHTGEVSGIAPESNYYFEIDGQHRRPDPTSRYQPHGVHGPSQVVASKQFPWLDAKWRGVDKTELVIYELHIGAFTREGTFQAATRRIKELVELGITAVELLPVAQCPGRRNWGYDGVNLFAPRNTYGTPNDFRAFVDACHRAGLAVILDVVYNHFGPEGNYLADFGPYFSKRHHTPWGDCFAYDGRHGAVLEAYVRANVRHWLADYHIDGLRLDAVHFMFDDRETTILDQIREEVTELQHEQMRPLHLIAEANVYDSRLVTGSTSKPPYDAIWCDDIMHSIYTHGINNLSLTHRTYRGGADLAEALEFGYLYTGPTVERATPPQKRAVHGDTDKRYLASFIVALQTHDSVGNHPHGKRIHQLTSPAFQQAAATLIMLYPAIPMIFMGEERATSSPFPFFVDFEDARLNSQVDQGRENEYPQHEWDGAIRPSSPDAFLVANDEFARSDAPQMRDWYRSLITLRKQLQTEGVIRPENLQVACDVPNGVYCLNYQTEMEPRFCIWVQLQADRALPVPLQGNRPLLDSWSDATASCTEPPFHRAVVWKTKTSS